MFVVCIITAVVIIICFCFHCEMKNNILKKILILLGSIFFIIKIIKYHTFHTISFIVFFSLWLLLTLVEIVFYFTN
jgi:hypothetical protein